MQKQILVVDFFQDHLNEICEAIKESGCNILLHATTNLSFGDLNPDQYIGIFVCHSCFNDIDLKYNCKQALIKFAKNNSSKKPLKIFLIIDKVLQSVRYKDNDVDEILNFPFDNDEILRKLQKNGCLYALESTIISENTFLSE